MRFIKGDAYSRDDIHQLYFKIPLPKKGTGNWLTGYVRVESELIIFININAAGRTGHDFDNKFLEDLDQLIWFGKPKTHSGQQLISKIINGTLKLHFFIRHDSSQKYFIYYGNGRVIEFEDRVPISHPSGDDSYSIKFLIQLHTKLNLEPLHDPVIPSLSSKSNTLTDGQEIYIKKFSTRVQEYFLKNFIFKVQDLLHFDLIEMYRNIPGSNLGIKSRSQILDFYNHCLRSYPLDDNHQTSENFYRKPSFSMISNPDFELRQLNLSIHQLNKFHIIGIKTVQDLVMIKPGQIAKLSKGHIQQLLDMRASFLDSKASKLSSNPKVSQVLENFTGLDQPIEVLDLPKKSLRQYLNTNCLSVKDFLTHAPRIQASTKDRLVEEEIKQSILASKGLPPLNIVGLVALFLPQDNQGLIKRLTGEITLEEAGDIQGVTRERIRQLEARTIQNLTKFKPLIIAELNKIKPTSSEPLYLWKLEFYSDFFSGLSSLIKNKKSAYLVLFQSDKAMFEIEIIGNRMLFNVKGKPTFIECINEIQKMNRQNTYEDYLFFKGRSDLTELVKIELQEAAPSSRAGKVKNFLSGFLPMQKTLLSTPALQKAASEELMIDVKANELLNSILYNFPNCYQFDTRAWGLEENFKKLDSSEAQIFATAAIEYLRERPDKKIASKTIFHSITTTDLQIDSSILASLNHFDLNWTLAKHMHQDPKLQNLGRLYWVYGQNHKSSSSTMKSLIEEFLTDSGKPMSTSHIKEYILTKRSIAGNFQIRPSTSMGDIIPTAPGVWGLAFRDLAITRDQEQQLLRQLTNEFKQGNFVINEAKLSMIMQAIPLDESLSLFQISRLLSRHASSNPSKKRDDFHVKTSVKHLNKCFVVSTESDVEWSSLEF